MHALAAACALATCLAAPGPDETDWLKLVKEASFPLAEAIDRGLKEAGAGVAFHAELEEDEGAIVYSIDIAQGDRTCNVVLGVKDGKVVEKEVEDEDHSDAVEACKITLGAAIDAAVKASPGEAVEARLGLKDGKPVVTVRILRDDGKLAVVRVDGATGKVLAAAAGPKPDRAGVFTDTFRVEAGEWSSTGANPYFILEPGFFLVLEGEEDGEALRLTITVLDETRVVAGVETRVVEEREEEGGRLVEVSRNCFAISKRTNAVYYFGEDVDIYKEGKVVGHGGAWLAGEKGARFGLMMPGTPLLGARYYQEVAPGVAMDRAEIVSLTKTLETPAGQFEGCLEVEETTPLERGKESKVYAAGIGLIRDADLKLTRYGRTKK